MNGTQASGCHSPGNLTAEKIGKTFAYCLIIVVSLTGNSLIGIIIFKNKTMQRKINYFILNMAVSDILLSIFVVPMDLVDLFFISDGLLGQTLCKVIVFVKYLSSVVSIESLVLIAVDRFGAVVFPLRRPFISSKICSFLILATWIFGVLALCPYLTAFQLFGHEGKWTCALLLIETDFLEEKYFQAFSLLFFALSFAVMFILYGIILFKLKFEKIPGELSAIAKQQRVKRHSKVLKMVIAIVSGFLLCWGPLTFLMFLTVFSWDNTTRLSCGVLQYSLIAKVMARGNCALNPCICFSFGRNFRDGLKSFIGCQRTVQD